MNKGFDVGESVFEVFQLRTDVVAAHVPAIRGRLKEMVASGARHISVDLTGVHMVDSAGIGVLISAHNSLKKLGGMFEITGASQEILQLFQAMRMHQHFRVVGGE